MAVGGYIFWNRLDFCVEIVDNSFMNTVQINIVYNRPSRAIPEHYSSGLGGSILRGLKMKLWALVNVATRVQRGFPFESRQEAESEAIELRELTDDIYAITPKDSVPGEAYISETGTSPQFNS